MPLRRCDALVTIRLRNVAVTTIRQMAREKAVDLFRTHIACNRRQSRPYLGHRYDPRVGPHSLFWSEQLALTGLAEPELPGLGGSIDWLFYRQCEGCSMRISGTVKFFNGAKGFGFISPADGSKDVFVHATALERAGIRSLNEGDKVTFVLEDDRKGRGKQAGQIELA